MSLIVHDTLSLNTQIGVCKIQLCIGDITKLSKDEEVDVLVVSAFPGDYSPTPSSLIGALAINLGISVRKLSKEKEEDLRKQYYCWWSKPLPEHLSFRRILCFEGGFGSRGQTPPQVVGAVFRCLVPILSGKDVKEGSVIMPLLASGDQGYSKRLMLQLLMDCAIHWIKAGLQLRILKIVLFSRHPEKPDKSFDPLFSLFQEMNAKYGEQVLSYETQLIYDVYMSHSPRDHDSALQVVKFLKTERNVSVFHDFQELNNNESWQEEIFDIMRRCARVIALLSPGYLETESCIEQYNMALCLNRRSHETILAPFYITSLDYMPTYMSIIQYEDCRPNNSEKLRSASNGVVKGLQSLQEDVIGVPSDKSRRPAQSYDVFISYSHCNKQSALSIVEILQSLDAELNLFIDTEGLNTGTSWQQTLYHALDRSKSTIALLSPDYIQSKVCYEEFCLSQALSVDRGSALELVSLLVEPVEELPAWCVKPVPVDCTQTQVNRKQVMAAVCTDLVNKLRGLFTSSEDELTRRVKDLRCQDLTMESVSDNYRKTCFVLRSNVLSSAVNIHTFTHASRAGQASGAFKSIDRHHMASSPEASQETSSELMSSSQLTSSDVTSNSTVPSLVTSSSQVASQMSAVCDVAVSFAEQDRKSAVLLKQLLLEKMPSLKISEPMSGDISRVQSLDVARAMVLLFSPAFLASNELIEELNIAICRNRSSSRRVLFPVHVAPLPPKPSYVHLIPCEASRSNYKWASKVVEQDVKDEVSRMAQHHHLDVDLVFCLKTAADQISERLAEESRETDNANRVFLSLHVVDENWKEVKKALREEQGLQRWKRAFGMKMDSGISDLENTTATELHENKPLITKDRAAYGGEKTENNVRFESESMVDTGNKERNGGELSLRGINSERDNDVRSLEQQKLTSQQPLRSSPQQEINGHELQQYSPVASSGERHGADGGLRNATKCEAESLKPNSKTCAVV